MLLISDHKLKMNHQYGTGDKKTKINMLQLYVRLPFVTWPRIRKEGILPHPTWLRADAKYLVYYQRGC